MKRLILTLLLAAIALPQLSNGQAEAAPKAPKKLHLVSGDSITGVVSGIKDDSVSLLTDYGVIRVPVQRLTEASRKELGITATANVEQLQKRVTELEALVERLRNENSDLRKQQAAAPASKPQPLALAGGGGASTPKTATPAPAASGASFWVSSTGKRHNPRCRYFGTGSGHSASASEGIACKICGG